MPLVHETEARLEIAHVLFIDIVGYSKLLADQQRELVRLLNEEVRKTEQFRRAEEADKLVRLPTGDGMALVFFTTPDAPLRCAMELDRRVKEYPQLNVRMGIHSGPVDVVHDVNDRRNVTGAGINLAQRVMDCADAGHILLSKRVADDLAQYERWQPHLYDLGACEVKHGVRIELVNFFDGEAGNPELPERLKRTQLEHAAVESRAAIAWRRKILVAGGAAVVLLLAMLGAWWRIRPTGNPPAVAERSLAVLPFENLSPDKENAYFADGVQDDVLTNLAKVADLKVISRKSVAQFRETTKSTREIGEILHVSHLLGGSVRKAGGRIRVSAQLIDARSDTQVWAEQYERELADVFAIQSEIAEAIVGHLKVAFSPAEKASIEQRPTDDLEAYDLYLRGKQLVRESPDAVSDPKFEEKLLAAITLLKKAVARDPTFALAYGFLVEANLTLYWANQTDAAAAGYIPAAEAALQELSRLAPDVGETHYARAMFLYRARRDYDNALQELDLAARSLPNSADVSILSAFVERRLGRWADAARHFSRAAELDPRNTLARSDGCRTLTQMRHYREAIDHRGSRDR
jgi:TolB-like protein